MRPYVCDGNILMRTYSEMSPSFDLPKRKFQLLIQFLESTSLPEKPFAMQKKPKRTGHRTQEEDGKNSAKKLS